MEKQPQLRGIIRKVLKMSPRKPNSGKRSIAKVWIPSYKKTIVASLPGKSFALPKNSYVLIRGKGPRDLPGVYCRVIPGKFDCPRGSKRTSRRSKYGVKRHKINGKKN